jgi:hypothetical protein
MATFWETPLGGNATLWQLLEGTTDLYFTCVGIDGDNDKVYAWKASDGKFQLLETVNKQRASVTTTYTVDVLDDIIFADTTGGAFTITLPPLADVSIKRLDIKKLVGAAPLLTIDADGTETIDGSLTLNIAGAGGNSVTLFPRTATDWSII